MADLKIPNLNMKSDKFLFKKKLSLRRKSKSKLIKELLIMFSFSFFIIYMVYLIPDKILIFNNLSKNLGKLLENITNSIFYIYEICLAIFIVISIFFALILMIGSFSRIIKILKRKTKRL